MDPLACKMVTVEANAETYDFVYIYLNVEAKEPVILALPNALVMPPETKRVLGWVNELRGVLADKGL